MTDQSKRSARKNWIRLGLTILACVAIGYEAGVGIGFGLFLLLVAEPWRDWDQEDEETWSDSSS